MKNYTVYVGLDVSFKTIDVSLAIAGRNGEVRRFGDIPYDMGAVGKLARNLVSKGHRPSFVYEAGPWGFELCRFLTSKGFDCRVVGPSMIPKKSGDKVKTDPRDSRMLASDLIGFIWAMYNLVLETEPIVLES